MKSRLCAGTLCLERANFRALGAREVSLKLLGPLSKLASSVLGDQAPWVSAG